LIIVILAQASAISRSESLDWEMFCIEQRNVQCNAG